ncbi:MAG: M20/M25/M40 family metallo-hydrolase, partial [Actinomycetota bacterium]
MTTRSKPLAVMAVATLLVGGGALLLRGDGDGPPDRRGAGRSSGPAGLEEQVTPEAVHAHLVEFQQFADEGDGNRSTGTEGHEASVDYVAGLLEGAGYDVDLQEFSAPVYTERTPSRLALEGTPRRPLEHGRDFVALLYSAPGRATARVTPVNFEAAAQSRTDVEGACDPAAFSSFPSGDIALVQTAATCFARDQVVNAVAAGAAAVIVSYLPEFDTERGIPRATLISPDGITAPVIAVTPEVGLRLFGMAPRPRVSLAVHGRTETVTTRNVIAQLGPTERVVMAGAHLDSVLDGPGINDNGSGSAALLEVALQLADERLRAGVRFAFWSGEEYGLLGSRHYIELLTPELKAATRVYLNFDMVGSPNFGRYIYEDGGRGRATELFEGYFARRGLTAETLDLQGRSDHGSFLSAGIPVGGLFTGAETALTAREAEMFEGRAGRPADSCYHLGCDDIDNVNRRA